MKMPIDSTLLDGILKEMDITDIAQATIRQSGDIARHMEKASQAEFLHLEMGVPGLKPEQVGVD
ncbi:MAG: pyridoxal phosphate-dependent aminotransferase, partial [Alistipes sp.]